MGLGDQVSKSLMNIRSPFIFRCDFECSKNCGILYLSLKYHKLHAGYIETRLNDLNGYQIKVSSGQINAFILKMFSSSSGAACPFQRGRSILFAPGPEYAMLSYLHLPGALLFRGRSSRIHRTFQKHRKQEGGQSAGRHPAEESGKNSGQ